MSNKHLKRMSTTRLLSAAIITGIIVTGCSSGETRGTPVADRSQESETPDGIPIVIEEWGVSFVLPSSIEPADITLRQYEAEPGESESVGVASTTLSDELRTDLCGGVALEAGEFLSIYRSDVSKDDTVQVGDHHYRILGSLADDECYDEEITAIYLTDEVKETVQQTLTERR